MHCLTCPQQFDCCILIEVKQVAQDECLGNEIFPQLGDPLVPQYGQALNVPLLHGLPVSSILSLGEGKTCFNLGYSYNYIYI